MSRGLSRCTLALEGGISCVSCSPSMVRCRPTVPSISSPALPLRDGGRVRIVSCRCRAEPRLGRHARGPTAATAAAAEAEDSALRVHRRRPGDAAERELRSARSDLVIEPVLLRGRARERASSTQRATCRPTLSSSGTVGSARWESALLGSVSAEVVGSRSVPRPRRPRRSDRVRSSSPIDGSPHARAAETIMTELPAVRRLADHVVSVVESRHSRCRRGGAAPLRGRRSTRIARAVRRRRRRRWRPPAPRPRPTVCAPRGSTPRRSSAWATPPARSSRSLALAAPG